MNLYFILEGEKTEMAVYPKWISYILPHFSKVDFESDAVKNNFYIFSGGGIPSIYNHTINAIKNINDNPIYDYLIVCLDGEEIGTQARIDELEKHIVDSGVKLVGNCILKIVIQNICIETWFLGNRRIVKKIPEGLKLREYIEHFDVVQNDPELMTKKAEYRNKAHFHFSYFREILKEHNLVYRKSNPDVVLAQPFFEEIESRVTETNDLPTFKYLLLLLYKIKELTI
jgi:hypothetical protein